MLELVELSVQDAIEVALAVSGIAAAGQATFKPMGGPTTALRLTEPAKLYLLVMEIVMDAPDAPELKLPELAAMVKSPTWTTEEVDCARGGGKSGQGDLAGEAVNARNDDRNLALSARVEVDWSACGYLESSHAAGKVRSVRDSSTRGRNPDVIGSRVR